MGAILETIIEINIAGVDININYLVNTIFKSMAYTAQIADYSGDLKWQDVELGKSYKF